MYIFWHRCVCVYVCLSVRAFTWGMPGYTRHVPLFRFQVCANTNCVCVFVFMCIYVYDNERVYIICASTFVNLGTCSTFHASCACVYLCVCGIHENAKAHTQQTQKTLIYICIHTYIHTYIYTYRDLSVCRMLKHAMWGTICVLLTAVTVSINI